jgi:hypothetical protein
VDREMNIMGDFWRDFARLQIFKKDRTQCSSLSVPVMSKRIFYTPISMVPPAYYSVITGGISVTGFKNYNYTLSCP